MGIKHKLKKTITNNGIDVNIPGIINKSKSARKDFKKYIKAVRMLITDAYHLDRKRFIAVLVTSGAGIAMLGFSLGVLLKYVKHLESNTPLKYFHYSLYPRDGFFLAFISISSMLLLILSAGLILYSRLKTRDILVDYNLAALSRVAEKFGWNPPDEIAWLSDSALRSDIKILYGSDSNRSGMTLRRISEGYQHFLTSFGGLGILLWLDAAATFYLILIILLSLVFFVKINKRASKATRDYENLSGDSARRSRALLANISAWPNPNIDKAILKSMTHESNLKNNHKLLFDRFATKSLTEFLSYVLTAAALGFLVITLGYSAIEGKKSWAAVVGYIIVLQTVMKSFKTLSKIVTEVTRVYPGLSRAYEFNKKPAAPHPKEKIDEVNLIFADDALSGNNQKSMTLKYGDIIGLSAPVTLSRYSVKFFEKVLKGSKLKEKRKRKGKKKITDFLNSMSIAVPLRPPLAPVTIRQLLGIPADIGAAELRNAAGSLAKQIEKVFPLDPETLITGHDMEKLSNDSLTWFSLISCSISDKPIILVQNSLLTDKWLKENETMLKNRILIVCFNGLPESSLTSIKTYIVSAPDGNIVAAGSYNFLKKRSAAIKTITDGRAQQLLMNSQKVLAEDSDMEDDDDDD